MCTAFKYQQKHVVASGSLAKLAMGLHGGAHGPKFANHRVLLGPIDVCGKKKSQKLENKGTLFSISLCSEKHELIVH